jgi:dolichyl-phosphate beta-glucosyltransferase
VLEQVCQGYESRANIVRSPRNQGKGEAVRIGLKRALENTDAKYVGYWDADLATPLNAIHCFIDVLKEKPDMAMIFGSRVKLLGRQIQRKPQRHYLGRIFATTVSQILKLEIYDTQCGAKLFRADSGIRLILDEPFLSKWVFDVELIARYLSLFRENSKSLAEHIYEYPLERWKDVGGSKVRPTDFLFAFLDLVRIRRKYFK